MEIDPLFHVHVLSFDFSKSAQKKLLELWKKGNERDALYASKHEWTPRQFQLLIERYKKYQEPHYINKIMTNYKYITIQNTEYPSELKEIADPPLVLFYKGDIRHLNHPKCAIVGTRNCSDYGQRTTRVLGNEISHYFTIVSGLAKGIDAVAHQAALLNGQPTIAVIGTAIDIQYPKENRRLYQSIQSSGLIVSEIPPFTKTEPFFFIMRNRIISGLSKGVLVTECGVKSGALKTANFALEQNRDVFTVPGSIFSKSSEGCNHLLKLGAKCVCSAHDVLSEFDIHIDRSLTKHPSHKAISEASEPSIELTDADRAILDHLHHDSPLHIDQIIELSGLPITQVLQLLTVLEMKSMVMQHPGTYYTKK